MKIRNGYISNSSSSSFVLNDKDDALIKAEKLRKLRKKKLERIVEEALKKDK